MNMIKNIIKKLLFNKQANIEIGKNAEIVKKSYKFNADTTYCPDFWQKYSNNTWEPKTFDIFDRFISSEFAYMDIGAWIGPTVLYGANSAKKVYAFEPDKIAFEKLQDNINLNEGLKAKVELFDVGLSAKNCKEKFYTGSGATSMSSVIPNNSNKDNCYFVDFLTLQSVVETYHIDFKEINFCKIDIEGGEYDLIPEMMNFLQSINHFPTLYISTHIPYFVDKKISDTEKNAISLEKNTQLFEALQKNYKYLYNSKFSIINNASQISKIKFSEIIATNIQQ